MDNPEFTLLWLENQSNIPNPDIKVYVNAASTEIVRMRGQLDERAGAIADLETVGVRLGNCNDESRSRIAGLRGWGQTLSW